MNPSPKTIFVGLSGGVDSSVAALRLKRAGHRVVGVFIRVWQPDFIVCTAERDRLDAMRVAAHLNIPFRTFDAEAVYKREVADYMIREYRAGRTPNPDVMCNRAVKFGAFLDYAKKEGADAIATGHYAQVEERAGTYHLLRGADPDKDQSYFLWTLTEDDLRMTLFPVGDSHKAAIREEAKAAGLRTSTKPDSQGVCFLGSFDMKEFLSHYIKTTQGDVLDEQGMVIGRHDGALFLTRGQRHGFTVTVASAASVPHYIIDRDVTQNTITVSTRPPQNKKETTLTLTNLNLIHKSLPEIITAQCRYRQQPFRARFTSTENSCGMLTILDDGVDTPASGQSCVLYNGTECLGGGIIP